MAGGATLGPGEAAACRDERVSSRGEIAYYLVLERRKFLHAAGAAAIAGAAAGCAAKSPWRFFTLDEARTLQAICESIIPADEDAGARQAGVVHYIDRQLAGKFREHRKTYRDGLAAVKGRPAADLGRAPETRAFFGLVVTHAMQGFYGSPRHGGNRDYIGYRIMGLAVPNLLGPEHLVMAPPGGPT